MNQFEPVSILFWFWIKNNQFRFFFTEPKIFHDFLRFTKESIYATQLATSLQSRKNRTTLTKDIQVSMWRKDAGENNNTCPKEKTNQGQKLNNYIYNVPRVLTNKHQMGWLDDERKKDTLTIWAATRETMWQPCRVSLGFSRWILSLL